ncbi:MAG: ATPase [Oscillospiraceae bacterium]|nr:ATPase [Oscillospiraceae bacterium]
MKVFLGIELGSTRIKAVAIDQSGKPLAAGGFDWENRFENSLWTYHLDDVWLGLQESFKQLCTDYKKKQGSELDEISGIGISAMMHGYLVLDKNGEQLAEFRTWRNTITEESAKILTDAFGFNIPQRWNIAHLHRAVTKREPHVSEIAHLTTLTGYVHYKLTGEKVVGIGDGSGIMPLDNNKKDYNAEMVSKFNELTAEYKLPWKLLDILPKVLCAGEEAGCLTEAGAKLLDPTGNLKPGIPFCPPEGDAGTGMVATNAITPRTGNISAGTSVFAMLVLEKALSKLHTEIDMVTTPTGSPVAMVHCNNCTADLDAWINLFADVLSQTLTQNQTPNKTELYSKLYNAALNGDPDCGGLVSVNYLSGEHITGFTEGRPIFIRTPESRFNVENFMRSLLFSAMASLKIGMNILTEDEGVEISKFLGHGGLFKTAVVGQKLMAGALNIPVAVMDSAGEGGAWGIALLAVYKVIKEKEETLEEFLNKKIFFSSEVKTIEPDPEDVKGFEAYLKRYKTALEVERTAVEKCKV